MGGSAKGSNKSRAHSYKSVGKQSVKIISKEPEKPLVKKHVVPRREPSDYQKIQISTAQVICLALTPRCCLSAKLKSLRKYLIKAENKMHRELDLPLFLKRVRDSQNLVMSYMTSKCFDSNTLY